MDKKRAERQFNWQAIREGQMALRFCLVMTFLAFASAFSAEAAPSKLECAVTLAAARNALATLGPLEKSLDAAAALKGEQLEGELKAAVEELDAKKAAFALSTNELAQATRNLAGVLERRARGE
jgi:uncharacterized membrane protein YoaK (UPF0700 family)